MANGDSSSKGGLVVGALVVGGVVGFLIGQAVEHSKKPGSTPSWTTASCLGSGNKNIQVVSSAPGCIEAEMWAATAQGSAKAADT